MVIMLLVKRFSIVFIMSFINVIDGGTHFPHVGFDYYVRDPIKAIKNYCPSYVSCSERHANDNQNLTHLELPVVDNGTCCIPCKCDDMCFHRGDCCYDKQLQQEHVDRSRINVYRSAEENITCWQAHTYQGFIDHAFLLLQDCDAPGNDPEVNDLREKCFNPSWDSMEENTPVYSKIDGGHYRNIFCAKCSNSVHDFVPWTVELGCYYDIDAFQLISVWNGSGFSQSLQNACSVIWEPPTDHLLPVKCHKPVVESCRDGDFPADISVLCTNYSTSASAPMLLFNKLYRNVYCAVCNYAVFEAPELFLSVLCIHGQHILRPQWPFVFVLKYRYRYETEPNETDDESPHDSVLVSEIGEYVTQTCSQLDMRVGDRCLKIFDEVKGFLLEYRVDAIFRSCKDMNFTVDGVKSVLTQLLKTEMYLFYEANLVGASVTDDGMVLSFSVLFEQTELIELEKAFSRFQDNMNRFNINEGHFSLRAGRSPYATIVAGKSLYIEYSSQRFGGDCIRPECVVIRRRRFAMAEIQFCKGFLFNEFKADAGKNAAIIFNMTFQTYEFAYKVDEANVTRIFMCQNTFFNKLNEWNVFESRNAGMAIRCIRLSVVLAVADLLIMVFNMYI